MTNKILILVWNREFFTICLETNAFPYKTTRFWKSVHSARNHFSFVCTFTHYVPEMSNCRTQNLRKSEQGLKPEPEFHAICAPYPGHKQYVELNLLLTAMFTYVNEPWGIWVCGNAQEAGWAALVATDWSNLQTRFLLFLQIKHSKTTLNCETIA